MTIKIYDFETATDRTAITPLTLLQFIKVNFSGWGFYSVKRVNAKCYLIYNCFTDSINYRITA